MTIEIFLQSPVRLRLRCGSIRKIVAIVALQRGLYVGAKAERSHKGETDHDSQRDQLTAERVISVRAATRA